MRLHNSSDHTLGNTSEPVLQALLALLKDENSSVRSSAAEALVNLGNTSEPVLQALLALLKEQDYFVRSSAAGALVNLGKKFGGVTSAVAQWIEQHQDTEDVGSTINALWDLVAGQS